MSRLPAAVQPPDPGHHLQAAAGVQRLPGAEVPRPAAAAPAQDSAQEAAAPAHLRPGPGEPWLVEAGHVTPCSPLIGPGVEEDRGEEDQVPGPGSAQVRAAQEDPGAGGAASSSWIQQSGDPDLSR